MCEEMREVMRTREARRLIIFCVGPLFVCFVPLAPLYFFLELLDIKDSLLDYRDKVVNTLTNTYKRTKVMNLCLPLFVGL